MEEAGQVEQQLGTDFDHTSARHAAAWPEIYDELRSKCPHARSRHHGGYWVATRYKDVYAMAQAPAFSTAKVYDPENGILRGGNIIPPFPVAPVLPVEAENDQWRGYRTFLNRRFSPAAAEQKRPVARSIARTLVDRVIESGRIDFVADLTSPLPAIATMELFGFDVSKWEDFAEPVHKYMYLRPDEPEFPAIVKKLDAIFDGLGAQAEDRKRNPRDDLMSYIANGSIDGRPLTEMEIKQLSLNLIFGGVDTTTALTSNAFHHLGRFPDDRRRLIEEPRLRPIAREEFIRFYAPVQSVARTATEDSNVGGWRIAEGDRILLAIASANRDPGTFADADQFRVDRQPNRHVGFGAGMHHCLGLFIARMMFDVMLDEVLERLPDYALIEDGAVRYGAVDKVNGWSHLPATFTPGAKLGGGMAL